ncbi:MULTISPECIES: 4-(cytidine 5'-diphospho)-2-C-methyl-D-erythritol kinase [unclassified Streptococcus]|uniref:4-(cytidine 5'-diphospho)-2-C-methyl-D-erythritol kinase n=1 Tax=unclassified Streptococcus TaxID=2608887 RepID=UPI0018AC4FBA|nr:MULTISPECIES: 4-(cytidine 5'-diphospho)-2-C-methyl-D-erythritol kinase [unclassified Streptococcus]MBF8969749.1 4-(cytidine 5'-diphospho)-2-C-methyl-D-erythritol kinase [Streptococcus sp. NLN76]MBG9367582.1 4-(cytidine 5'-diphospho)-2-C-methyl-D-erythritol kinase [Streptococcus sp. NLN64]
MKEIVEKAPAKINLGLDVRGKREDGFHELGMVMASVDLNDYITVREREDQQITLESSSSKLPLNFKNHAYKAAFYLRQAAGLEDRGVHISIDKRIPITSGLAGGSSDAAATLRALNRLWDLDYSLEQLAEIGAKVGSDVPYCVYGGCAYVTGRGEQVHPLARAPKVWVVLIKPPFSLSTTAIFSQVEMHSIKPVDIPTLCQAINEENYEQLLANLGNSLEDISIARKPMIQKIKNCAAASGADATLMSGSGPTVFALCSSDKAACRVVNSVKGFCKEVYRVRML